MRRKATTATKSRAAGIGINGSTMGRLARSLAPPRKKAVAKKAPARSLPASRKAALGNELQAVIDDMGGLLGRRSK